MIICAAKVTNPQNTILEIAITMPFSDWGKVLDMLRNIPSQHEQHPLWPLRGAIQKSMSIVQDRITEKIEGLGD